MNSQTQRIFHHDQIGENSWRSKKCIVIPINDFDVITFHHHFFQLIIESGKSSRSTTQKRRLIANAARMALIYLPEDSSAFWACPEFTHIDDSCFFDSTAWSVGWDESITTNVLIKNVKAKRVALISLKHIRLTRSFWIIRKIWLLGCFVSQLIATFIFEIARVPSRPFKFHVMRFAEF